MVNGLVGTFGVVRAVELIHQSDSLALLGNSKTKNSTLLYIGEKTKSKRKRKQTIYARYERSEVE